MSGNDSSRRNSDETGERRAARISSGLEGIVEDDESAEEDERHPGTSAIRKAGSKFEMNSRTKKNNENRESVIEVREDR